MTVLKFPGVVPGGGEVDRRSWGLPCGHGQAGREAERRREELRCQEGEEGRCEGRREDSGTKHAGSKHAGSKHAGSKKHGAGKSKAESPLPRGAVFFDLDRTLLSGASGPAISAALRQVGLMSDRHIPGQDVIFRVFNTFGENLPSMLLTRQAASMAANWPRDRAREAGQVAAGSLIDLVQPYAKVLIDEHRADGRLLVLATTTPYDLIKPLADLLGLRRRHRHPLRRA